MAIVFLRRRCSNPNVSKTTANLCTSLMCFRDKVSLRTFGCSETHSVDQVPVELRDAFATAGGKGIHHHAGFFSFSFFLVCV